MGKSLVLVFLTHSVDARRGGRDGGHGFSVSSRLNDVRRTLYAAERAVYQSVPVSRRTLIRCLQAVPGRGAAPWRGLPGTAAAVSIAVTLLRQPPPRHRGPRLSRTQEPDRPGCSSHRHTTKQSSLSVSLWHLCRAFNCRILYGLYLPTVILTVIWYSITHSLFFFQA